MDDTQNVEGRAPRVRRAENVIGADDTGDAVTEKCAKRLGASAAALCRFGRRIEANDDKNAGDVMTQKIGRFSKPPPFGLTE